NFRFRPPFLRRFDPRQRFADPMPGLVELTEIGMRCCEVSEERRLPYSCPDSATIGESGGNSVDGLRRIASQRQYTAQSGDSQSLPERAACLLRQRNSFSQ